MGRRTRVLAAVISVALVAVACKSSSNGTNATATNQTKTGGVFRLGTSSTIDSLNPFVGFQANSLLVWQYTYPYLTSYDENNAADKGDVGDEALRERP